MKIWIEKQQHLIDFTLASLARRKAKNLGLLAIYTLLPDELEQLSGHRLEVRTNPALIRAQEVHRLVGSASTLTAAVGHLPYQEFRETLAWMLEAQRRDA